jgi:hypothetical protein
MPRANPNYHPEGGERRPTPLERPLPYDHDTPRAWMDACHFWRAQQPDATAWEKVIGYYLPMTYEEASRMTPSDAERIYREAPDTIEVRRTVNQHSGVPT